MVTILSLSSVALAVTRELLGVLGAVVLVVLFGVAGLLLLPATRGLRPLVPGGVLPCPLQYLHLGGDVDIRGFYNENMSDGRIRKIWSLPQTEEVMFSVPSICLHVWVCGTWQQKVRQH